MDNKLRLVIEELKEGRKVHTFNSQQINQSILLQIISALQWNIFDPKEVQLGYPVGQSLMDFALLDRGAAVVLINTLRQGVKLQSQIEDLKRNGRRSGAKRVVLTNGISWWIIEPVSRGRWEHTTIHTMNLYDQRVEEVQSRFWQLLSKKQVLGGKDEKESAMSRKVEDLSEAWITILRTPDMRLVELVADTVEKHYGYRPDYSEVIRFIETLSTPTRRSERSNKGENTGYGHPPIPQWYTGKKIVSFAIDGRQYEVHSWKDLLYTLARILYSQQPYEFEKVLQLRGSKRPYFSKRASDLRVPMLLNGSDIYMETHHSTASIVKVCRQMVQLFGYHEGDLEITTSEQ